ncbi:hypothetical protein LguiB_011256 [Lonicera macranthoides]
MIPFPSNPTLSTVFSLPSTPTTASSSETETEDSPKITSHESLHQIPFSPSHRSLAILTGHVGSVSCLSLCGEFIISASLGNDIIVWQNPDLKQFTKFGHGDGSVKALVTVGNKVFTAHQDSRIRVWKISMSSENVFKLADTLPTRKDYLGNFMKKGNHVKTRMRTKCLWISHSDSVSCLAVDNGLMYSGSWDKTIKVWRVSDLKCLESIKAHDDAINELVSRNGVVYSASADGKIKAWGKEEGKKGLGFHSLKGVLEGHKDVSMNSVVVSDDGGVVYGGSSDGYIMGWVKIGGFKRYKILCEVKAHKMAVLCMCLKGEVLCSGSADKSIGIWRRGIDGVGVYRVGVISGHEGPVKCLQASDSSVGGGFLLYSGSLDRSLRVWWVPMYTDKKEDAFSTIQCKEHKEFISW